MMKKSLREIYRECLLNRNAYMQLTDLDSGKVDNGKMSVINMITFIIASAIYTYETILDVFKVDVAKLLARRVNGTAPYYASVAKMFQYAGDGKNDEMVFNEDTYQVEYKVKNEDNRIIEEAACSSNSQYDLILKVCKKNKDTASRSPFTQLNLQELSAFRSYIDSIKFIGAKIKCQSSPPDLVYVSGTVKYDARYHVKEQVEKDILAAMEELSKGFSFSSQVSYQLIFNLISDVTGVTTVNSDLHVWVRQYNDGVGSYGERELVGTNIDLHSGYLSFYDAGNSNIEFGETGINLQPSGNE